MSVKWLVCLQMSHFYAILSKILALCSIYELRPDRATFSCFADYGFILFYPGISILKIGRQKKEQDIMANVITDETIDYVGILAKLELSAEEKEQAKKDLVEMLDYIDQLGELDTTGVEPMSHVFPVHNVFREDVVTNGDDRDSILKNAPEEKDGMFLVPNTF